VTCQALSGKGCHTSHSIVKELWTAETHKQAVRVVDWPKSNKVHGMKWLWPNIRKALSWDLLGWTDKNHDEPQSGQSAIWMKNLRNTSVECCLYITLSGTEATSTWNYSSTLTLIALSLIKHWMKSTFTFSISICETCVMTFSFALSYWQTLWGWSCILSNH
jgi:hypothetical protein